MNKLKKITFKFPKCSTKSDFRCLIVNIKTNKNHTNIYKMCVFIRRFLTRKRTFAFKSSIYADYFLFEIIFNRKPMQKNLNFI